MKEEPTVPETPRPYLQVLGIFLLLVISLAGMPDSAQAGVDTGHFETDCVSCHLSPGNVEPEQAHRLTGSQERLCGECHGDVAQASHPVGFVPNRALPAGFPLDERGQMNCSTCHDLHADNKGRIRADKRDRDLCVSCHTTDFFSGMADRGESLMLSAHLGAGPMPGGPVDAYSMKCMICHSDNATISSRKVASRGFMVPAIGASNHPIGADYGRFAMSRNYNSQSTLPREMLLPDGKLSCLTCHKGFSQKHGEVLRAENLCTQCHNK